MTKSKNPERVRDLMVPLENYAQVRDDATLREAIAKLRAAQTSRKSDRQPQRAVLVTNRDGKVIGQLGHLDLLRALEPRYSLLGDLDLLSRAGVSGELVDSLVGHLRFWEGDLDSICRRAAGRCVREYMRPLTETIEADATVAEAAHKIVLWQTLRALVTDGETVLGVLRLADLVETVSDRIADPGPAVD